MTYFNPDFIQFFKELAGNNNREWFTENKKRYEREVKKPFENFITDLIARIATDDKTVKIAAKDAIFRIYRDVRFSNDKSPYKVQASAIVSAGGRKDMLSPGIYVEMTPEHVRVYSGIYMPDKDSLYKVRNYIVNHMKEFSELIANKQFIKVFGEVRGEKNKIIPKEFKEAAESQPLLFNKQYYYFSEMEPEAALDEKLIDRIFNVYLAAKPMNLFMQKALKG